MRNQQTYAPNVQNIHAAVGFCPPIKKYAIPYFFYSLFYALFNSLTFMLIIPILNTMFDANYSFEYVEKLPPLELNQDYLATLFNFAYSHIFEQYDRQNVLMLLAIVAICISLMSNLFRYLGAWTMENMRTRTLQRMRNEMFSRVMDMNVGYFSTSARATSFRKSPPTWAWCSSASPTPSRCRSANRF